MAGDTKILTFEGGNADHVRTFETLHQAMRFGRNHQQSSPGKEIMRRERDVRRKLEAVGTKKTFKCPNCQHDIITPDNAAFTLTAEGGRVTLNAAEIELLQERIDKGVWNGDGAVDMADAYDFLVMAQAPPAPAAIAAPATPTPPEAAGV